MPGSDASTTTMRYLIARVYLHTRYQFRLSVDDEELGRNYRIETEFKRTSTRCRDRLAQLPTRLNTHLATYLDSCPYSTHSHHVPPSRTTTQHAHFGIRYHSRPSVFGKGRRRNQTKRWNVSRHINSHPENIVKLTPIQPFHSTPFSIRKELKVRPGFTPEEDKARYRNQSSAQSARLKSFVPGSTSQSSSSFLAQDPPDLTSNGQFPSLSAAQKKNLKRKDKRRAEKEQEEAKDWDEEEQEEDEGGRKEEVGAEENAPAEATHSLSSSDPNADPKQALRHLIQQTVTSSPASRPPAPSSTSSSTPVATSSPTSTPSKPREKKDPRPGGLFGAALRVAKHMSSATNPTSESTTTTTTAAASDLNTQVDNLTLGESTPAEGTSPTSKTMEKKIKPGSGLYKDLGIQPKSKTPSSTPTPSSAQTQPTQPPHTRQSKPTPPGAATPSTTNKKPTSTPPNAPRTRPEVRVRPGGGLGGLMKEIAEKNAGSK